MKWPKNWCSIGAISRFSKAIWAMRLGASSAYRGTRYAGVKKWCAASACMWLLHAVTILCCCMLVLAVAGVML